MIIYLDDMIATVDIAEHFQILRKVFDRLIENKLGLRLDKCEFLWTLGYRMVRALGRMIGVFVR